MTYIVKNGQSLFDIATQIYGDAGRAVEIADTNSVRIHLLPSIGTELILSDDGVNEVETIANNAFRYVPRFNSLSDPPDVVDGIFDGTFDITFE